MRVDGEITFRPAGSADLAMLEAWIARPHWQEWWGDPATEAGLIRDMIENRDTTRPFIFAIDGEETGYIQYWKAADQLVEPWLTEAPWLLELPDGTVGIDLSIAEESLLSKGIGSAVLNRFASLLVADGYREIIIDPDPENRRAVRAYRKAGFRPVPELLGRTGDCLIMKLDLETVSKS